MWGTHDYSHSKWGLCFCINPAHFYLYYWRNIMKKIAFFLCTILLAANAHAYDDNSKITGNFNVFVGKKHLDDGGDNGWQPLDSQFEYGILFNIKPKNWPISLTADILHSTDKEDYLGIEATGSTTEFDLGITKHWQTDSITPYIGGGAAIINAEVELGSYSQDETELGVWGKAGAFVTVDDGTNIGFELRYSYAETDFNGTDVEIGGYHAGVFIGYHW